MNTAIMIGDNTRTLNPSPAGAGVKGASESAGDEPQQRFADVLPLAQAAREQTPDKDMPEKARSTDRSARGQGQTESSGDAERPAGHREEAPSADVQAAWSVMGIVHPLIPRQAGSVSAGKQGVEPTIAKRGAMASEQTSTGQDGAALTAAPQRTRGTQTVPQASMAQKSEIARPAAPASPVAVSQGQAIPLAAVTGARQSSVASQQTPGEKAAEPVPQTTAGGKGVVRSELRPEQSQAAAPSKAVHSSSQSTPGQEASAGIKAKPGSDPVVASEKPSQSSVNPPSGQGQQTVDPDAAAQSGKSVPAPTSPVEGNPSGATKAGATARTDHSKGEPVRAEGKEGVSTGVKDGGAVMTEVRAISSAGSPTTAQPVGSSPQSTSGVEVPTSRNPVQSVSDQILDSIRSSGAPGEREVFIRLRPPELGTVVVRFQERGENLTGTLEVSTREAQREIERALPQVLRSLQDAGIQIRRVEVVTSDQPDRNLGGEHLPQDTWQQHQGTGQGREHAPPSQARWPQGLGEQHSVRQGASGDDPQISAPSGRIDVLL
ncbi:MAG TPA: flagellar hook-length control protein FliK [Sedimentisphaerales bacterium]|nr:flagellar hook-length control protein FliK [Sedimentisphaerales bacterium]